MNLQVHAFHHNKDVSYKNKPGAHLRSWDKDDLCCPQRSYIWDICYCLPSSGEYIYSCLKNKIKYVNIKKKNISTKEIASTLDNVYLTCTAS